MNKRIFIAIIAFMACASFGYAEDEEPDFLTEIHPIVQEHCVKCHREDKAKGDLNLERFETDGQVLDAIALWQRAAKRVQSNEMPPGRDNKLPEDQKALFLKWVGSLKFDASDCNRIANEESVAWFRGYVNSRRINRTEYENTLHDLLYIDIPLKDMFPADGAGGEGFDTAGAALFLSAIQIEKYLVAADLAVETAIPSSDDTSKLAEAYRRRLIRVMPGGELDEYTAAQASVRTFLERAWRRPVYDEEVERHMELFQNAIDAGDNYVDAIKFTYKAALISPNFLFLAEPEPAEKGVYSLGDYQLASRMSYFLWGTMPDDELFRAASAGELQDDEMLRAQILRMQQDPKARGLAESFGFQWLGISQLGEITRPDENKFPQFTDAISEDMKEEAALLFTHVVREDRSILELIDADHTFVNEDLAKLYGIEGVQGPEFRRVALADRQRGGIVSLPAVLTATSHPLRTSPVLRGKWVLETVLGDRVPPPPPNVPALPEEEEHGEGLTLREQLELHRTKAECASCHNRMDPLGFGLENFDAIGRWRDTRNSRPIDTAGTLPSGESFSGPEQLKDVLLNRKDQFARNFSKKMVGYAIGRGLSQYDHCIVDKAMEALKENDYRASALFTEIIMSYSFRHRYSGGEIEEDAS